MVGKFSNKRVEDMMPIATGHEREELQAEIEVSSISVAACSFSVLI